MTGSGSTGCGWTRRAPRCWRRSSARWPRRNPRPSTARTSGPATSAGRRAGRGLPPRRRRRRVRAGHRQGRGGGDDGLPDLVERTGAGTTLTGELLAPETVRRMACDAAIIPAVLGSKGEVLDLGRTVRLATPKQVQALWIRDKGLHLPGLFKAPSLV